jgi:hypothetical protein
MKHMWQSTPPAAAGVAMTRLDFSALQALGLVALWTAALAVFLTVLERWPQKGTAVQSSKVTWEDRADRLGSIFGPKTGPLVAHWLRFYFRNSRFRTMYPLVLPLAAFLFFVVMRQSKGISPLAGALTAFGVLGFMGTVQFAVNQFGYVGGGFRRFLLLPTDAAAAFRAGSYMFVSLSAALIPVAAILWCLFAPMPVNGYLLAMLLGTSLTTLFLFHGLALWTSLLGPRRGKFNHTFGNDLSFAGNVVVMGGMFGLLLGPQILAKASPAMVSTAYWFATPLFAVIAAIFYFVSLRLTTALFRTKREELMVLMEGKG